MTPAQLTARDLLCPHWQAVGPYERFRDVAVDAQRRAPVYAVFETDGRFMGIVDARQAVLFPGRVFADLLLRRQVPVSAEAAIDEVIARMDREAVDYQPVSEADGRLVGVISRLSIFSGLSARERDLRAERERLIQRLTCELEHREVAAAVFEGMLEGIMVTDVEQRIVLVNRAFSQTTGYSAEEVIGQRPRLLHSGRHDAAFYGAMWQALEREGLWEGEIWNRRKSGEIYPEWLRIQAVDNAQGQRRYYVGIFSDISQHSDMRARLLHLAYYDTLTGLANRQLLLNRLQTAIAHARRADERFAVLYLDLDHFKDLNDTRGHRFGDQVLVGVAQRLSGHLRATDTVARLGGDEFVIILDQVGSDVAIVETADKLIGLMRQPMEVGGERLYVGASIGIARYPEDGDDPDSLLMRADAALYRAKQNGRCGYEFHSERMHERQRKRLELTQALRRAMEKGELWLAWQPQIRLADGRIVGAEALLRWTDADGSPVSPAQFVAVAEESGLIQGLGEWVFAQVGADGPRLIAASPISLRLGVNLSPLQIRMGAATQLLQLLTRHGLSVHHLMLELTESALAAHRDGVLSLLATLLEHGAGISVDDFGTGCSNLAMLKALPITQIKIDRGFVMDVLDDVNDRQIVTAMIEMAHALGLEVVAEGVETPEQAALLRELGCDLAQGYFHGRPMSLSQLLDRLQTEVPDDFRPG